jgi:tetratricopeptide (TPR) repeat protein
LEIDDSVAEAHTVLGLVRRDYEWDWSGAERACKRAIEVNPNYAWGHAAWSDWMVIMGLCDEAMAEAELAVELDPLSAGLNFKLLHKLVLIGDYDRVLEQAQKTLELDPNFVHAHALLAQVFGRE